MSNGYLIVGFMKKILLYKMSYFSEPYTHSKNKIKVEVDSSNCATKSDFKKKQDLIYQILRKSLVYLA